MNMKKLWGTMAVFNAIFAYLNIDAGNNGTALVDIFFYVFFMYCYNSKGITK